MIVRLISKLKSLYYVLFSGKKSYFVIAWDKNEDKFGFEGWCTPEALHLALSKLRASDCCDRSVEFLDHCKEIASGE